MANNTEDKIISVGIPGYEQNELNLEETLAFIKQDEERLSRIPDSDWLTEKQKEQTKVWLEKSIAACKGAVKRYLQRQKEKQDG